MEKREEMKREKERKMQRKKERAKRTVKSLEYNQCNHLSVIKIIAIPSKSNFS